jgi:antitoxin component HigA of HigAB toxin-antitoxin module
MEQRGYQQKDLVSAIGLKSRVSEILNWKKTKSLFSQKSSHIHRVSKHNNFIKQKTSFNAITNVIFATKLV